MARTGQAALDWCARQVTHPSQDWYQWCLVFSRKAFDVGPVHPDATQAWLHTRHRQGTISTPPPAVPVWWTGGSNNFGHVVVSAGNGYCYSSDIKRRGKIDLVPIVLITRNWGLAYKGWTEDINGVRVYTAAPAQPEVDLSEVRAALRQNTPLPPGREQSLSDVWRVEKALVAEGLLPALKPAGGYTGVGFRQAYAQWQRRSGVGGPYDGDPGMQSLTLLGQRYGFRVVP